MNPQSQRAQKPDSGILDYCRAISPRFRWDWPHLAYIAERLDAVARGDLLRLMLFLPPRHGKSELGTIRFPGYLLERDPETRVIIAAYNQTLAEKFSRRARTIVLQRNAVPLDEGRTAVADWLTASGGGVRAVGVGGGVTGMGGNFILIDDPVKSRLEANSETYRERCWEWYSNDLYTRLEPHAAIVLTMTRWHTDDLAGRILANDSGHEWEVVNLPAEAGPEDPLGRIEGDALCPDRYDLAALADRRRVLGPEYEALFQGRPFPAEGSMFKAMGTQYADALPSGLYRTRRWDVASLQGAGDYTCGVLMAATMDGRFFVEDVVRGRWSSDERNAIMRSTADADRQRGHVKQVVPQDPGSAGKDMSRAFVKLLAGHPVTVERESGSKEQRADPYAAQWNAGNVWLLAAPWNAEYVTELLSFPLGTHDDMVDASSGAFSTLSRTPPTQAPMGISKASIWANLASSNSGANDGW